MRVRQPKYPIGSQVRTREKVILGCRLKRGEIGEIIDAPRTIQGGFTGEYDVLFPSLGHCAVVNEGTLYTPRRKQPPKKHPNGVR